MGEDRTGIVGSWKIVSFDIEFQDTGERRPYFGGPANGYGLFTRDGRAMFYLEADKRKPATDDAKRAIAYRGILAYTGRYRIEGDRFITSVDGSWNVVWTGTDVGRTFKLAGDRLDIIADWAAAPLFNNRMARGVLTWQRERAP